MMSKIFVMLSLLAAAVTHAAEQSQRVSVETPHMSIVLEVSKDMLQYPEQQPGESDSAYELRVNANKLKLTKLGSQLDTIAYNKTGNNTLGYAYVDNYVISKSNSKIITRNILTSIIIDIFDSAKADDDASRQTEVDAFNTLIDSIKEQMTIVKDSDKVMSWQRELGYVSTLVKLI